MGSKPKAVAPEAYLGAFGKHPGWNDHIDDLGLETDRLVSLRRVMYLEGIGATIDAGAWDKLTDTQRIEGFAHVFCWRTHGDTVIGRMWSSRDGKGRTKYPMVVCAQFVGVPFGVALNAALPELEALQASCESATDAAGVRASIDAARARLRAALPAAAGNQPDLVVRGQLLSQLAARPEMGPDCVGFYRILYQVEREMGGYLRRSADSGSRTRRIDIRPQQIRVPGCGSTIAEVIETWSGFLLNLLDLSTPVLIIVPLNREWADLIVGEPSGSQLYCIKATPKGVPLTSDIPYNLDAHQIQQMKGMIAAAAGEPPAVVTLAGRRA